MTRKQRTTAMLAEYDGASVETAKARAEDALGDVEAAQADMLDFLEDWWARTHPGEQNPYSPERRPHA